MQSLEKYLADLKSTKKNTIETVEKSLTGMFIRLVRIYPCLCRLSVVPIMHINKQSVPFDWILYSLCQGNTKGDVRYRPRQSRYHSRLGHDSESMHTNCEGVHKANTDCVDKTPR